MSGAGHDEERTGCFSLEELLQQAGNDKRQLTATLTCLAGRAMGKVYRLAHGGTVLGRSETAAIQLEDEGISRKHAEVTEVDGGYLLRDLNSTNGTTCNGQRVQEPVMLRDGDRVRLGPTTVLRFDYQDELEEQMQSRLYDMATRDALTGAYNRRFLSDRLGAEWAWAYRHRRPCAVIAFDLDHFKMVNDTHGHGGGDAVLKGVVDVVLHTIRKEDLLARTGGEEFLILARATNATEGRVLAERVRIAVEGRAYPHDSKLLRITLSAGMCTTLNRSVTTPEQLVARADEMLYRAKEGGRNRVVWDEENER